MEKSGEGSTVTLSSFSSGLTYYFRVFSYATKNNAEWVHGTSLTASAATTATISVPVAAGPAHLLMLLAETVPVPAVQELFWFDGVTKHYRLKGKEIKWLEEMQPGR